MAALTRREALAVLHQVYNTSVDQVIASAEAFSSNASLRYQAIQALFLLTDAIHGPREPGESYVLGASCHLRRARYAIGSCDSCDACRPQETAIPVAQLCSAAPEVFDPIQSRARRHNL